MEYVFTCKDLGKKYGTFSALTGMNMEIPKGAIYGFVGKNGAGKTTLIRLLCGLQQPTSGSFELMGIANDSKDIVKARRRMGAVVESPAIYKDLSARSNLIQQCLMLGLPDFDKVDELLTLVGLADTGNKKARKFSLGMKQRLGLAIALCGDPDFIILDEPTNGLDPQGIIEIRELIRFIVLFLLGMIISVLPIFIWLLAKGIFGDFINVYLIFNFMYSDRMTGNKIVAFFTFFDTSVMILAFLSLIFSVKKHWLNICYMVYLLVTIVFMVMSGVHYGHYGMVLIPGLVYPFSLLFHNVEMIVDDKARRVVSNLLAIFLLWLVVISDWMGVVQNIPAIYKDRNSDHLSATMTEVVDIIQELTDENDSISVYGNWNAVYVLSGRRHATRFSFQFPIGGIDSSLMDEYWNELQEELPPVIVITGGYYHDDIKMFLMNNEYEMIYAENETDPEYGALIYART